RRSGRARPRLERQDGDFLRQMRSVQTQLINVAGIAVVVGEINVAIQRIDDRSSEAALARSKRNLSDQGRRDIALLEFYLVDFGADGGVAVVGAVVGVAVNGIDGPAINEGRDAVEIDRADADWWVRTRSHLDFDDARNVRAGGAKGGNEVGVAFLG